MADKSFSQEVFRETSERIQKLTFGDEGKNKAMLANLRHGAGKMPGEDPKTWGILFSDLPEQMLGMYGEPSEAEWAIYIALTLYAIHQQGNDPRTHSVSTEKISLGFAANLLVAKEGGDEDARERVRKRFLQVAMATDIQSLSYYLRSFIQLLKANDIGLDYPMLAKDLYLYQNPNAMQTVRLRWGQDFYRVNAENESNNE